MEREPESNSLPPEENPNDKRGEFIAETPSDITMEGNENRDTDEGVEESETKTKWNGIEQRSDDSAGRGLWSPDDRFRESPIGGERLEK